MKTKNTKFSKFQIEKFEVAKLTNLKSIQGGSDVSNEDDVKTTSSLHGNSVVRTLRTSRPI